LQNIPIDALKLGNFFQNTHIQVFWTAWGVYIGK